MRYLLLLIILIGCKQNSSTRFKTIDLKVFSLQVPNNWNYHEQRGIDSFVGMIKGPGIEIEFDYSEFGYASNLVETESEYLENRLWMPLCTFCEPGIIYTTGNIEGTIEAEKKKRPASDTSDIIVRRHPEPTVEIKKIADSLRNNEVTDHYMATLTYNGKEVYVPIELPEEITNHTISIDTIDRYILRKVKPNSVGNGLTGVYYEELEGSFNFNIYAYNLDEQNQVAFLEAIETLVLTR